MAGDPILILGSNGQIGWELGCTLAPLGPVVSASRDGRLGPAVNLAEPGELQRVLEQVRPALVVNAAAYTAVDQAESEPEQAYRLNAEVPAELGEWAEQRGVTVIHYSTDYVYSGDKDAPYTETDPKEPINVYGESKLAGDVALLESGAHAIVLRVGWVYGTRGRNFLRTMHELMAKKAPLNIVNDQLGTPTWSRLIAESTAQVAGQLVRRRIEPADARGVYHMSPEGETSWYGFAEAIREIADLDCRLNPIPTSDYPTAARRPLNSRLDSTKLRRTFGLTLPDWHESLQRCMSC